MIKSLGLLLTLGLVTACVGAPATPSPSSSPTAPPTASPSPEPSRSPVADFYLRAWVSQALPPRETFSWAPMVTIAEGMLLDGNVAVPAIYPGPLMIVPFARSISDAGVTALIDEATALGLLGEQTDFTGGALMPGSQSAHIELVVDGVSRELIGDPQLSLPCQPGTCQPQPGTPEAFAAFWQELTNAQTILESELGPVGQYEPEQIALLLTAPPAAEPGLSPEPVAWPLETPLADSGVEFPGSEGERCVALEGDDLAAMLPILQQGNQLTTFADEESLQRGVVVRVLVPGEDSPCPDFAPTE